MDEKNKEIVVLGVISRGISKFDKISQEVKIEPNSLEFILQTFRIVKADLPI